MSALAPLPSASIRNQLVRPTPKSDSDLLFQEFDPLVRRLLRKYGDSADERAELRGEIYYRFRALLNAYDPNRGVPLRPYLVRMLTASIHTYARQKWIRLRREISLETLGSEAATSTSDDPAQICAERILAVEFATLLSEEIARLPGRQRQVLLWRYYEGRSFEWISDCLEIRSSTVRSLLRHALNRLRARLREETGGEE